ncbi:MAG TPA: SHOCT domain-containing protein [Elainellaceae cyanobacterium]
MTQPSILKHITLPRNRNVSIILAFLGIVVPGLHKFYLREWRWGMVYLILGITHVPQIAGVIEGLWYWSQSDDEFDHNFNRTISFPSLHNHTQPESIDVKPRIDDALYSSQSDSIEAIANAVRQLEALRQDGLMSEYEFEQKRRRLLDRID